MCDVRWNSSQYELLTQAADAGGGAAQAGVAELRQFIPSIGPAPTSAPTPTPGLMPTLGAAPIGATPGASVAHNSLLVEGKPYARMHPPVVDVQFVCLHMLLTEHS